ncbi:MAG: ISAs1 family transposase [Bacteroidota bacterium]
MVEPTAKRALISVFLWKLGDLDDFRDPFRITYNFVEILFLVFSGLLCNCQSYEEIVDFGQLKIDWLRKFLPYKEGIPSHDTLRRILSILNTKQLEKVLAGISSYSIELPEGTIINIDGKRISRSATVKEQQTKKIDGGKQAVNMVNVYCSMFNSCLASIRVSSKAGEKNAIEDILTMLELSRCLITLDAGYCYPDVAKQIVEAKADYLIGLKGNQPKTFEAAKDVLTNSKAIEVHQDEQEDSHGRLEQRTCTVLKISDLEQHFVDQYKEIFLRWLGLKYLIMVVCQRTVKAKNKTSAEARFYISSSLLTAKQANQVVRGHWEVENSLHWILDASMGEDKGRKRADNSAANLSIFRKLAFNKLKAFDDPKVSMKRKMKKCAMSEAYLEKVLGITTH